MSLRRFVVVGLLAGSVVSAPWTTPPVAEAVTSTVDIVGPVGSGRFGERLVVLPNGNFMVFDTAFDSAAQPDVGAAYLYDGDTNQLISMLTGSSANDRIGQASTTLANGNVLVRSPAWDNGAVTDAGAVTYVNTTTGLSGVVSAANSLVGGSTNDQVGNSVSTLPLNGNAVAVTSTWDSGGIADVGATTWINGAAGLSGVVGPGNSFVGTTLNDGLSMAVTTIGNGNYVIRMPGWDNGGVIDAGSATFALGTGPVTGSPSVARSLVGSLPADGVGTGVTALTGTNNYVVRSPLWNNGATPDVGAATWGSGTTGVTGVVSPANSLIGSAASDEVGTGVNTLTNGNYIVRSPQWNNGGVADVGAVTWRAGTGPGSGVVSAVNSIVGSTANDQIGITVGTLSNGNYLARSPVWDNAAIIDAGSSTLGNGATGTVGVVSAANSLVGTHASDQIGLIGVLNNTSGNFMIFSPVWNNGAALLAGAVTWGNGTTGVVGGVSAANSIVGTTAGDQVASNGTTINNGNFVIISSVWDNGAVVDAGAVTWVNGATGTVGAVGPGNSIVGTTTMDSVGQLGANVLTNGNFVIPTPLWDNGATVDAGAVTLVNGVIGGAGPVSVANSVVGLRANDRVGSGVTSLSDGNYVVLSPLWDNGLIADAGAATWMNGAGPSTASVTSGNSLVGSTANDQVGVGGAASLGAGDYLVRSQLWDNAGVVDAGAVTYGDPGGLAGVVTASNSVRGLALNGGPSLVTNSTVTGAGGFLIGRVTENIVSVLLAPFRPNFNALAPARLADTRPGSPTVDGVGAGTGMLGAGATLEVVVAGRGGVPEGAGAAALNVTSVGATAFGFATVFPCGDPRPSASTLNFTDGSVVPNAVAIQIGDDGKVCIFVNQPTHIVVDVNGFFPTTTSFRSSTPARLADTRPGEPTVDGLQQGGGPVGHGGVLEVQVAGRAGVKSSATAAALNITITEPVLPGFVTVFPCGEPRPTASNLNYVAGLTVANLVISKIGAGGKVCIFVQTATHVIVDVTGYFPARTSWTAINPVRLLDTRPGQPTIDGQFAGAGIQLNGTTIALHVAGRGGVPANADTVMLNVTATTPFVDGFLTVFPCGIPVPLASNVNYRVGQTVPNAVLTELGSGGNVCIFTSQPVHIVADITGYIPG